MPRQRIQVEAFFRRPSFAPSIPTVFQEKDRKALPEEALRKRGPTADVPGVSVEEKDRRSRNGRVFLRWRPRLFRRVALPFEFIPPRLDPHPVRCGEVDVHTLLTRQDRGLSRIAAGRLEEEELCQGWR
jgi:hypothetical protein